MHFHRIVARFGVVEDLVVDAHRAIRLAGTLATDNVQDVRRTAEELAVAHHRPQVRVIPDAASELDSTVASACDHDDVISGAARLERFADTDFPRPAVACY